ncbi:hypothetical protein COCCADRAFT_21795 [Bipolaris zeicola 26-R-13]|uniref:Uncharacterized protein n=1 Tax=Cochliobolus carbonum (strain 26-R-13) TaxID=930089 RepID=W6YMM8_COCC2|nr:uncharacterized protein COCCADRAFT_21795 [Bipolaris zeicola 26-R-13]EUC38748.1 hypothetical protein COCCADRAFT_21795 [Bipolaris zeicola 26-R-13]
MAKDAPQQSPPTPGAASAPESPRSPCSPSKTAELWDGYERLAVEKAKERDELMHETHERDDCSTSRTSFDFRFKRAQTTIPSTTTSGCKFCGRPIIYASGMCEGCFKRTVISPGNEEITTPLGASEHNMAVSGLCQISLREEIITPTYASPKRASFCPLPAHLTDASTRTSSTQPGSVGRRKKSPSEPTQPSLQLQITPSTHTPRSQANSPPMTPTSPPGTAHSLNSTRRSSLANVTMLPKPRYPHARNDSGTPSEFSTLYQTVSTTTTPPASLHRFGYPLQNTTSAWDDWDSDEEEEQGEEEERPGLSSWMGRRKIRSRNGGGAGGSGGGSGAKASMDQYDSSGEETREKMTMARKSRDERVEQSRVESVGGMSVRVERLVEPSRDNKVKKPSGFVRALSCGCGTAE